MPILPDVTKCLKYGMLLVPLSVLKNEMKSCWHLIKEKKPLVALKDNGWNQQSEGNDIHWMHQTR